MASARGRARSRTPTTSGALCLLPLAEQSRLLAARALSAVELAEAHLDRIARLDPSLHAFITVTADRALADAHESDRRRGAGSPRGALDGIPIALKDVFDTAGIRTTAGSAIFAARVPVTDSAVATRLRAAGTVLLGKLTMHEFAIGRPHLDGPFAPARNPWDTSRVPGGSSSGSAAAVSAGLAAASVGSDTGASVRGPAAACGIVGFKPSGSAVPRGGMVALSPSLDVAGPLARTVADTAAIFAALGGPRMEERPRDELRIGTIASDPDDDVGLALEAALAVLAGGGPVKTVIVDLAAGAAAFRTILAAEAARGHERRLADLSSAYGRGTRERLSPGLRVAAEELAAAREDRARFARELGDVFGDVDIIALPTTRRTARTFVEEAAATPELGSPSLGWVATLADLPCISVPCGLDRLGLPIGLSLMAARAGDAFVLGVANAYESETPWHLAHPPLA